MAHPTTEFSKLLSIVEKLLGENGCPWDKQQTHQSIRSYLLEEAYETYEAIKEKKWQSLKEELGDLLFQIIFHCALAEKSHYFTLEDVLSSLKEKLIGRHPHVFADERVTTAREQIVKWDEYKSKEDKKSLLERVPKSMPALLQAFELQSRAHRLGFKWAAIAGVKKKFKEELREWNEAVQSKKKKAMEEELGDFLFMITNWGRWLNLNAEEALLAANVKFRRRFANLQKLLAEKGLGLKDCPQKELEALWRKTKKHVR